MFNHTKEFQKKKLNFKMTKIKEIAKYLDERYLEELRAPWDATDGFLQGDLNKDVNSVLVTVELNKKLINKKFDLLVLHHPPKFGKDKMITNPFYSELQKDSPIYVLHSRIDVSGDINKSLAEFLFESFNIEKTLDDGTIIISLKEEMLLPKITNILKKKLNKDKLKVIQKKKNIKRIAIHGGEGFNQHHVEKAIKENIDLYIAGDLTHHLAESAFFHNVSFIDIDHTSEQIGMKKLTEDLQNKFTDCNFKYINSEPFWNLK
jgi:GTP cyclohydrolase I